MNELQSKAFELLKEVDEICTRCGIDHYLGPTSLGLAMIFGGHSGDSINLDMIIPASRMQDFVDEVNKVNRPDRAVDYMGNYRNHLAFTIEYVDKTTTLIKMSQGTDVSCYGIKVTLLPLRRDVPGLTGTWAGMLETGWECNGYRLTKNITVKRMISTAIVRIAMIVGKGRLARHLFRKFVKVYSARSENVAFKRPKKKQFRVDGANFDIIEKISFEGREFPMATNAEAMMKAFYGPLWKTNLENRNLSYSNAIISSRIPYEEYLEKCRSMGQSLEDLFAFKRKNLISGVFAFKDFNAKAKAVLIAKRSGDRLHYYEEFQQKREIILNLYANGDFEKLAEIFAEHEARTLFYLGHKLGFCVSREYFDIQCDIFRYEGREELIDKITRLIPAEHYKPII